MSPGLPIVPYVDGGGPQQQLDLYIPTEGKNMPLVVYVHGGGLEHGDKAGDILNTGNLQLLWEGYAMASINYRLAPAAIWPAQIQDCKAAIRWLKAHAHQYGYDPNRIAVIGESAGGHLVAMLGTTSGSKTFDVGENLDSSSDVTCVVDLFGVADITIFDGPNFPFLGGLSRTTWTLHDRRVQLITCMLTSLRCSSCMALPIALFPILKRNF